jgi:hypothetical protein
VSIRARLIAVIRELREQPQSDWRLLVSKNSTSGVWDLELLRNLGLGTWSFPENVTTFVATFRAKNPGKTAFVTTLRPPGGLKAFLIFEFRFSIDE